MNSYCEMVFNQINVNIHSLTAIINDVTEEELAYRPLLTSGLFKSCCSIYVSFVVQTIIFP
ncbi:hypothetical protein MUB16_24230 [Priestia sp. OVL9]|nr:hypothetical protein [Priestia sp. OVL9]